MKLFKISIISIISILIFQSQLYGINLSCDFEQRLNDRELNGVTCSQKFKPICQIKSEDRHHSWISEVIIKKKDVVIMKEQSDYSRSISNNKRRKELRSEDEERGLKVESVIHQKGEWIIKTLDERYKQDRYIFVISNKIEFNSSSYTLLFDNMTKQSTLTEYNSNYRESLDGTHTKSLSNPVNYTVSYFGECEELD